MWSVSLYFSRVKLLLHLTQENGVWPLCWSRWLFKCPLRRKLLLHSGRWKGFPQVDSRMLSELRLLSKGLTALATGEGLLAPVHPLVELHGAFQEKLLPHSGHWKGSSSLRSHLCSVRCECLRKLWLHSAQKNDFSLVWTLRCSVGLDCRGKLFLLSAQENSFCLLWTWLRRVSLEGWVNLLLHCAQENGFSSLWRAWWAFMVFFQEKVLPHSGHGKGFSPLC